MANFLTYTPEKVTIARLFQSHRSDCSSRTLIMTGSVRHDARAKLKTPRFPVKTHLFVMERALRQMAAAARAAMLTPLPEVSEMTGNFLK
ncbi:MAG TPA: hypothetical protein VLJ61_00910 [Pyrinomonadaceae bacterium]|nr:hypothetical protein [Pyrinomonadaceae bacterium]